MFGRKPHAARARTPAQRLDARIICGMDGEAHTRPLVPGIEEHRVRHGLIPRHGMVIRKDALRIELIISRRGGGEPLNAQRIAFHPLAAGGDGPIVQQVEGAVHPPTEHIHMLRNGAARRLADIEKQIEVLRQFGRQRLLQSCCQGR